MSITVKIPGTLRNKTGGESSIDVMGNTVGACLETLIQRYPNLRGEILDAQGRLLMKWDVLVNGRLFINPDALLYPVKCGDVIVFIPMIAGG